MLLQNINLVDIDKGECRKASVLLKNGLIAKIYSGCSVKMPNHQVENLNGAFILPGFTDSHTHLLAHGIEKLRIDLSECRSPAECLEKLNENKQNSQVFGVNWDESAWLRGKRTDLDKSVLDRITRSKPVIMRRICGHFAICNTKALESISPRWQVVDRRNGYLYEDAALYLSRIFRPSDEMFFNGLGLAMQEANSLGITSIHEITDARGFRIYKCMKRKLNVRVALYRQPDSHVKSCDPCSIRRFGDDFLKLMGIKIFMDGSIGAKTAALDRHYRRTLDRGMLLMSENELVPLIKKAERASLQLMIHSIGDRATEVVLRAFKKAGLEQNRQRHRLEHLEIVTKSQVKEIAGRGILASMQPNFIRWQEPGGMYEEYLGARFRRMNCFRNVMESGAVVIFGSDCMPLGPLDGIRSALGHPCRSARPGLIEALRSYTELPPYATFDENKKGKLEQGKFADLIVLNRNPLDRKNIDGLKILKVYVAGKAVYRA